MSPVIEWDHCRLGEVTVPVSTWNPRRDPRSSIRYIDVSAVSRDELRIVSEATYSADEPPSRARKIVEAGDTIFATVRPTLRRIAQIPASLDGEIVSTAFCVLRPALHAIDSDFLYFATQLGSVMDGIAAMESGASYPAVRDVDVLDQVVPLPPLPEQREIAAVLNVIRIALLHQAQCEVSATALKRTAMRTLFTCGLRAEERKETEIGPVPESWDIKNYDDVAEKITVGVVVKPASHYVREGIPAFRSLNVKEDRLDTSDLVYFSKEENDGPLSKSRLSAGDILVVRTGYPGTSCVVSNDFEGANCIDLAIVSPDRKRALPEFLSRFLNSEAGKAQSRAAKHGLAQQHLNVGALKRLKVSLPPTLGEQVEIVTILEAIDRKIQLHRRKRTVLEELLKALLHKLMTGEIRVGELDLSEIG